MSPLKRFETADWDKVPTHLHHQLERWLVDGIKPKSRFLYAVLRGDREAERAASIAELAALADIDAFLTQECPPQAFGSLANVFAWAEMGGWRGMRDAPDKVDIYEHPWHGRLWKSGKEDEDE